MDGADAGAASAGSGITAAPRIRFSVLLSSGLFTKPAVAIVGDPEKEKSLLMLNRNILPGGSYCDEPGTAIIGSGLAKDLGLKPGDKLKIIATRADGGIGSTYNLVGGLYRQIHRCIEARNLDEAQRLQNLSCDLVVRLLDANLLPATKHVLSRRGVDCGPSRLPLTLGASAAVGKLDRFIDSGVLDAFLN